MVPCTNRLFQALARTVLGGTWSKFFCSVKLGHNVFPRSTIVENTQLESSRSKNIEPGSSWSKHTIFWSSRSKDKVQTSTLNCELKSRESLWSRKLWSFSSCAKLQKGIFSRPKSRKYFGRAESPHTHFESQWSQHNRVEVSDLCFYRERSNTHQSSTENP